MIRINRLLRTARLIQKVPARGGPGWDRPDVPPTQRVERDTKYTQQQIIYTFFDSSMPEFFLTQPQVYEGGLLEGLPQLCSIWGVFLGTAFTIFLFNQLVNHRRTHKVTQPYRSNYLLRQIKRINEEKISFKYAKQNPFGVNMNSEQFPHENFGKYYYPQRYFVVKASVENLQLINRQASQYLKAALQRAKNSHSHH